MSSSRKKIILFNNNTFPPGFVSKIKRNFKNFNFIILKDHEFKKNVHTIQTKSKKVSLNSREPQGYHKGNAKDNFP